MRSLLDKLNFTANTNFIYKICQSHLYCLFKLKHLGVNTTILKTFYRTVSVLSFSFLAWFGGLNVKNKGVLNIVVNQCGKVVNEKQETLTVLFERRMRRKAVIIAADHSNSLSQLYELLPSKDATEYQKLKLYERKRVSSLCQY